MAEGPGKWELAFSGDSVSDLQGEEVLELCPNNAHTRNTAELHLKSG